eukprot:522794-Rhodomonas_salina.5
MELDRHTPQSACLRAERCAALTRRVVLAGSRSTRRKSSPSARIKRRCSARSTRKGSALSSGTT